MLLGTDIASAMTTLEALRVDVIGLNCSTGPEHMREPIRFLADERDATGVVHPERGAAAQHGHRRRDLSARAGADGARCSASSSSSSACGSSAAVAERARSIWRRSSQRRGREAARRRRRGTARTADLRRASRSAASRYTRLQSPARVVAPCARRTSTRIRSRCSSASA